MSKEIISEWIDLVYTSLIVERMTFTLACLRNIDENSSLTYWKLGQFLLLRDEKY